MDEQNPIVSIDAGDFSEISQAATAWAGALRKDVAQAKGEQAQQAADRIDAAVARANRVAYSSKA